MNARLCKRKIEYVSSMLTQRGRRPRQGHIGQFLLNFSTTEKWTHFCFEFGNAWVGSRVAFSLSRPSIHVERGQSSKNGCRQDRPSHRHWNIVRLLGKRFTRLRIDLPAVVPRVGAAEESILRLLWTLSTREVMRLPTSAGALEATSKPERM